MITAEEARVLLDGTTPGPWVQGWEDHHGWVAWVSELGHKEMDERLVITAPETSEETVQADARLIAAAPDLAESVIALTERAEKAEAELAEAHKAKAVWLKVEAELFAAREREKRIRAQADRLVTCLVTIRDAWDDYTAGLIGEADVSSAIGFDQVPALDGAEPKGVGAGDQRWLLHIDTDGQRHYYRPKGADTA